MGCDGCGGSWILINASGEEMVLEAVDKRTIMHRVQIHPRDLRIIDIFLSYPSTIIHIKAIITSQEVLLREPLNGKVRPIVEELRRRLKPIRSNFEYQYDLNGEEIFTQEYKSPFEFRALEVALEAICNYLDGRTMETEIDVYRALDKLTAKIRGRNLDKVRKLKSRITRLIARVQKVRDEVERLLDNNDDMEDFCLSRKLAGASSPGSIATSLFLGSSRLGSKISKGNCASLAPIGMGDNSVEQLEMLLEANFTQIDGTFNKLTKLREYIDDTEDYVNIQLANRRNQLMQLEIVLGAGTVSISIYAVIAGIFGENITYTWNDNHEYMFKWVVICGGIVSAFVFLLIIAYARYKGLIGS